MPGAARPSRKSLVLDYLRIHHPPEVTPEVLRDIRRHTSASQRYILDLAEQAGVPVSRELGGIPLDLAARLHLHDLTSAEAFLRDLHQDYASRPDDCRRTVLRARRRLESMLRRPGLSPEKRAEKEEILSWVRVWLEAPGLFPAWLDLRHRALGSA